jgi:hypothetical protein
MKVTKKFLSALMAMTMVCGTAVTVNAEGENTPTENAISAEGAQQNPVSQAVEGTGATEGWVETNIMRVVIPTISLDFQVDAHGLVKKSFASGIKNAQKYDNTYTIVYSNKADANGAAIKDITDAKITNEKNPNVLDDGFVFFTTEDPKSHKKTMANHIDLVLENKGTYAVDIKPTLSYDQGSGVQGDAYSSTVASNKGLAFNIFSKAKTTDGKSYTYTALTSSSSVPAGDASQYYKTTYDSATAKYKYALDDTAYAKDTKLDNKATFTIEGFSSAAAFDSDAKTAGKIKVVWAVSKHTENP